MCLIGLTYNHSILKFVNIYNYNDIVKNMYYILIYACHQILVWRRQLLKYPIFIAQNCILTYFFYYIFHILCRFNAKYFKVLFYSVNLII